MDKLKWHTETRTIEQLVPYEKNPRRLTDKQYEDLKASLTKFSLAEIPVIDADGVIIAGHMRLKVLAEIETPHAEVDVRVPNRKLTEKEFQEYNIRSNKNTGEFDFDILANEFDVDDLLDWGFTEAEMVGAVFQDMEDAMDGLPDGDKAEFQQVTFTLHDTQAEQVKEAMKLAKSKGAFVDSVNENGNGNALARIVETYITQNG